MKKSKILTFIMAIFLMISFFASCGNQSETNEKNKTATEQQSESQNKNDTNEIKNYIIEDGNISEIEYCSVGDCILLGKYEQDNDLTNGNEDIEWLVIEKEVDRILVVSKYALDCQPYNDERVSTSWETCSIKAWLNSVFFYVAFSESEANMISEILISEEEELMYDTQDEEEKENKLFLLSIEEMNEYLGKNAVCVPTDYAVSKGAYVSKDVTVNGKAACCWWLRTSADSQTGETNAFVYEDSLKQDISAYVSNIAVRPAMWIELES